MLDGAVNSKNGGIWDSPRPYVVHERSLHSNYIIVWFGFTADFILGPFFFEQNTSQGTQNVPSWVHAIAISFNSTSFPLYVNDSA